LCKAHPAFQGDDVFRKDKGLVIESGIIGAAALTTKDMKGTRQSRKTTLLVTCFVFFVSRRWASLPVQGRALQNQDNSDILAPMGISPSDSRPGLCPHDLGARCRRPLVGPGIKPTRSA